MKRIRASIVIFSKGLLMGISDIIPGVSGGTIALIVGIYERLIRGIRGLSITFLFTLCRYAARRDDRYLKKAREEFLAMDFALFIPLGIGILIAFGIGSLVIPYLLDHYPAYIFALFFGLILGSVQIVYGRLGKPGILDFAIAGAGFALALCIVGMPRMEIDHTYPVVFFSGMIAICAMLLPGVSGSFMLLMLGQYRFMLEALKHLEIGIGATFIVGAVIGLLGFSRVISYMLREFHSQTMAFLTGLMLGALWLPLRKVLFVRALYPDLDFAWSAQAVLAVALIAASSFAMVLLIERLAKRV